MLNILLESRARRTRRATWMVVSAVGHAALITVAVAVRASGTERPEELAPPPLPVYVDARPQAPATGAVTTARTPRTSQTPPSTPFVPPLDVEAGIPPVDIRVSPHVDFEGGAANASNQASGGGTATLTSAAGVYHANQVERSVIPAAGNPLPRFPETLRAGGVEGKVLVQFVVDTTGRVEPGSIRVLSSSHDLYESAVRVVLPRYRFRAAQVGGVPVRQLVQMPFGFTLKR